MLFTYLNNYNIFLRESSRKLYSKTHQIAQVTRNLGSICCNTPRDGELPTNLFHDSVELSDAKEIATAFNSYFATIGEKLAASIHENNNVSDDFQ